MIELCYICLNSIDCNWRSYTDPRSGYGGKRRKKEISSLSSVKILISYILQTSKSGDMEKLRQEILSFAKEGQFSICHKCFMKAEDLLDLHLELEKIQMQILNVLKQLQDYLGARARVGKTSLEMERVEGLRNSALSWFHDVFFKEFVHHDLSDGSQVRLERLESMGFPYSNSIPVLLRNDMENLEGFIDEDIEDSYSPFDKCREIEINPGPIVAKRSPGRPRKWPKKPTSSKEKNVRQDGDGVVGLALLRLKSEATDLTYSDDVCCSIEDISSPPMIVETRKREIKPIVAKRGRGRPPKSRKIGNNSQSRGVVGARTAVLGSQVEVTNQDRDEVISGDPECQDDDDCGDDSFISPDQTEEEETKPVIIPKRGISSRRAKLYGASPLNEHGIPENDPIHSDPEFSDADEDKHFSSSDEEFNPKSHFKKAKRGRRPPKNTKHGTGGGSNCDICLNKIPFNSMESHLKTHPEFEKYYECDLCPPVQKPRKYGTFKGLVWHHFKATHKVPLLSCEFCPSQRTRYEKRKLCEHLYKVHYPFHKKLQCEKEDCFAEFCDPYSLQLHEKQEHGDAGIYPCDVCQKMFKTKGYMRSHRMEVHGKGLRFQCTSCTEDFKTLGKLRKHEEETHGKVLVTEPEEKQEKVPVQVQCPYCSKTLSSSLSSHIKNIHERDPNKVQRSQPIKVKRPIGRPPNPNSRRRSRGNLTWDCDICLEKIPFKQHESHLKTHPEFEKFYKCELCPNHRWTRNYGTYKGFVWHHLRAQHKVKLRCQLCPDQNEFFQEFGRKELCKHLYDCHYPNLRKLECKVEGCFEEFYEHHSLRDHRMQQHPETAYRCELCPRVFATKYVLQKHMEKDPHGRKERFQCASCPKDFANIGSLRQHEKTHEEGYVPKQKVKEQCPHCAVVVSAGGLTTHIKSVHAEKSLICRYCGKAFGLKFHLKRHEDAHRGEKKYKCTKCSYAGTTSSSLNRHMTLHREKSFQCQYCPKAFPIKRYWEDHERTHTKEKPYKCDHCEMAFNARNMLSAHRRKIHGIAAVQQCLAGVGIQVSREAEQEEQTDNKFETCIGKTEFP